MRKNEISVSSKKLGRWTGFFYFLIIFCGLYSGLFVREALIDYSDPSGTLTNLIEQESTFRMGFLADLVMVICDVMVAVLFYYLLRFVHGGIALLAMVFRLIQAAILGANLIQLYKPLLLIQGHGEMADNQLVQLGHEVLQQMQLFEYGYLISGVFFSVNCLLMGFLLFRSKQFPKVFGWMITTASFGYLFNCLASFGAPSLIEISQIIMFFTAVVSEVSLCFYLLIAGGKAGAKLDLSLG
ncbi:DUF4386 domain-containing protein [bacterium SCSIO 12741]|nr:DUF4386 domain-containing protein [bacterium SCSIO 12741]